MAKFVFLSVPAFGHFNPTLPIVAELARRGNDVTVVNSEEFRTTTNALGARFVPFPIKFSSKQLAEILVNGNLGRAVVFSREAALKIVPWLNDLLEADPPDCAVYDAQAIYGHISCKMLDLKSVSFFPYPVVETTRHLLGWRISMAALAQNGPHVWPMIRTRIAIQRRFGIDTFPTKRPRFQSRGDLTVLATVPELQHAHAWRDETMHYVGPLIDETVRHSEFDFDALDGRPLVYVSLGTLASANLGFYKTVVATLKDLPIQVVMSIGQKHGAADLGETPANFIVGPYLPQLQILARAALFVTHAGFNGLQEALWHGVPMIGIPQQIEQYMNASLLRQHGAGLLLDHHFTGREVPPDELRAAVENMLADPAHAAAARRLGSLIRRGGGAQRAADIIEARGRGEMPRASAWLGAADLPN